MDNSIEITAKTEEEAIEKALIKLGIERKDAEIEILKESSKGILGIKTKDAVVRVTVKENKCEKAEDFLDEIFKFMGINADIDIKDNEDIVKIDISSNESGIIIGRRGETLEALQFLTNLAVNKGKCSYKKIVIDTEHYREKRRETLQRLAERIAGKVERYGKDITLEPMNPYERRIIHYTLQTNPEIETYSIGEEPYRKVVVALKNV